MFTEFQESQGPLDDVDFRVVEARIALNDYQGQRPDLPSVPSIRLTLDIGAQEDYVQYWKIGDAKDFVPNEAGTGIDCIGAKTKISASSAGAIFMIKLFDAGFPKEKMPDNDVSALEGLEGHIMRIPAPASWKEAAKRRGGEGADKEQSIPVVASITKLPWDKAGAAPAGAKGKVGAKAGAAKGKAAAAPAPAPAPEPETGGEEMSLEEEATNILITLISANEKGVAKAELPGLIYRPAAKGGYDTNPRKKDIVQVYFKPGFLENGPWTFANGRLTLA